MGTQRIIAKKKGPTPPWSTSWDVKNSLNSFWSTSWDVPDPPITGGTYIGIGSNGSFTGNNMQLNIPAHPVGACLVAIMTIPQSAATPPGGSGWVPLLNPQYGGVYLNVWTRVGEGAATPYVETWTGVSGWFHNKVLAYDGVVFRDYVLGTSNGSGTSRSWPASSYSGRVIHITGDGAFGTTYPGSETTRFDSQFGNSLYIAAADYEGVASAAVGTGPNTNWCSGTVILSS